MASSELSVRLKYLRDSAHLLAITSPAVSRHLMSKHDSLLLESDADLTESRPGEACGACGTIMILGWEGSLEINPRHGKRKKQDSTTSTETSKVMVYKCDSCDRTTRFSIPIDLKVPRYKPTTSRLESSKIVKPAATNTEPSVAPTSASSTGSKKRAKPKKQSGLSAILAKQKATQANSSGFGFDLMDFMKKT